jgi:hypothetical protein
MCGNFTRKQPFLQAYCSLSAQSAIKVRNRTGKALAAFKPIVWKVQSAKGERRRKYRE